MKGYVHVRDNSSMYISREAHNGNHSNIQQICLINFSNPDRTEKNFFYNTAPY